MFWKTRLGIPGFLRCWQSILQMHRSCTVCMKKYVVFSVNNTNNYKTVEYHTQSASFFLSSNCLSTASERAWRNVVIVTLGDWK